MDSNTLALEKAKEADREYLIRRASFTGYQYFSLLVPPLYTTFLLARKGRSSWNMNGFLRANWIGGVTGESASHTVS